MGRGLEKTIKTFLGIETKSVKTRRVYDIDADIGDSELESLEKNLFIDPVTECPARELDEDFDWLIEVGYRPGVTNPVSKTATAAANEILKGKLEREDSISTATQYLISGIGRADAERITEGLLSNPIIESATILSGDDANANVLPMAPHRTDEADGGGTPNVKAYDLMVGDDQLVEISKKGVLSLSLAEMRIIQRHCQSQDFLDGRKKIGMDGQFLDKLTDVELEALAQTQSEHCKH